MGFFQHLEGHAAIIVENGVFKQTDLYSRDNRLFAKSGSGFIRLMADGSTTKAKARLELLSIETPLYKSALGHLLLGNEANARPLEKPMAIKLVAPAAPEASQ